MKVLVAVGHYAQDRGFREQEFSFNTDVLKYLPPQVERITFQNKMGYSAKCRALINHAKHIKAEIVVELHLNGFDKPLSKQRTELLMWYEEKTRPTTCFHLGRRLVDYYVDEHSKISSIGSRLGWTKKEVYRTEVKQNAGYLLKLGYNNDITTLVYEPFFLTEPHHLHYTPEDVGRILTNWYHDL